MYRRQWNPRTQNLSLGSDVGLGARFNSVQQCCSRRQLLFFREAFTVSLVSMVLLAVLNEQWLRFIALVPSCSYVDSPSTCTGGAFAYVGSRRLCARGSRSE
eukprot:2221164-Amphidinium_carterae.1